MQFLLSKEEEADLGESLTRCMLIKVTTRKPIAEYSEREGSLLVSLDVELRAVRSLASTVGSWSVPLLG